MAEPLGLPEISALAIPPSSLQTTPRRIDTTATDVPYWHASYGATFNGVVTAQPWTAPSGLAIHVTGAPRSDYMWAGDSQRSPGGNGWNGECTHCYVDLSTTITSESAPVPEPATGVLFAAALGLYRLRRLIPQ